MNKDTLLKELDGRIENIMSLRDWRKREAENYLKSRKIYVSNQLMVESLMAGRLNSLITEIMRFLRSRIRIQSRMSQNATRSRLRMKDSMNCSTTKVFRHISFSDRIHHILSETVSDSL